MVTKSNKYTITSDRMLSEAFQDAAKALQKHGTINVQWRAGSSRSMNQNDLYWMWVGEIVDQANALLVKSSELTDDIVPFSKEEMHEWLCEEFLGYETHTVGSKQITTLKGTSKLLKGEMYFYMQQVDAFAHSKGFKLTIPEDSEYTKLKKRENE